MFPNYDPPPMLPLIPTNPWATVLAVLTGAQLVLDTQAAARRRRKRAKMAAGTKPSGAKPKSREGRLYVRFTPAAQKAIARLEAAGLNPDAAISNAVIAYAKAQEATLATLIG